MGTASSRKPMTTRMKNSPPLGLSGQYRLMYEGIAPGHCGVPELISMVSQVMLDVYAAF
jgi:hypothetical protein